MEYGLRDSCIISRHVLKMGSLWNVASVSVLLPITTDEQKLSVHMTTNKKHFAVCAHRDSMHSQGHIYIETVSASLYHILTLHQQTQQEV